ncbi:hypothetical protein JNUCC83_08860 [Vagococcus sp. JNUCC 83]
MKNIDIYVAGSWNESLTQYGWSYVVVEDGQAIYTRYGKGTNEKYIASRQMGGEVAAVLQALGYANKNDYSHIILHYSYEGIEKWISGEIQLNSEVSKVYHYMFYKLKEDVTVTFSALQGQTNHHFSHAKKLARRGSERQ